MCYLLAPGQVNLLMNRYQMVQWVGCGLVSVCAQHGIDHETMQCLRTALAHMDLIGTHRRMAVMQIPHERTTTYL